jgi:hypothetical protein
MVPYHLVSWVEEPVEHACRTARRCILVQGDTWYRSHKVQITHHTPSTYRTLSNVKCDGFTLSSSHWMWTRHSALGVDEMLSGPYTTHGSAMDSGRLAIATTISPLASTTSQGGVVDYCDLHRIQMSTRNPFDPMWPSWLFPSQKEIVSIA